MEERRLFQILENAGYSDVFRDLNPTTSAFTTFPEGKYKGFKARVDYFIASADMQPNIMACTVRPRTIVSDHAAIEITLKRLGTNLWFDFANWHLLPMPKIDPAWYKPKIPIMPQRIVVGMVLMGPPPPPPPRGVAAEVTGAVDDVQLVAAITDAQLEAMMKAHDEAVAAEAAAADFDRQLVAMVNAHDAAAVAAIPAAVVDDVQLAAAITDAQLEAMMKAHEEAAAAATAAEVAAEVAAADFDRQLVAMVNAHDAAAAATAAANDAESAAGLASTRMVIRRRRAAATKATALELSLAPLPKPLNEFGQPPPGNFSRATDEELYTEEGRQRRKEEINAYYDQFALPHRLIERRNHSEEGQRQKEKEQEEERLEVEECLKQVRLIRQAKPTAQYQVDNAALIAQHKASKAQHTPPQEAPIARQRIDRAEANEEYRISSLEAFARSERQRIAPQQPRDPLLTPTRDIDQWIPQSPFSPTRPPILPVARATPPRVPRRRIQPALVPQSVAPATTGPAAPFGSTKEQRARARRWYEKEYPTNQKTVRPAHAYTDAELELMLQPTPSPPPRDDSQRKLTAAEREELDEEEREEERKLTAAEQLVLAADEEKEEEHAQSRPQTPVRSLPRSIPHFSPMTPEEGEMPTTHDYLRKCDDVVIDWSIPAVSDSMLRVGPSRYGCYRGGAVVDAVGDALSAVVDIAAGQAIASFNGTRITMAEARQMQEEDQGRYLIQIDDDQVLDCKAQATARPPLCFASNANQAQGLLLHGRILTIDHNNAAVELIPDTNDVTQAILYAVVPIPATQDIMWSYGEEFAGGFEEEHSALSTIATDSSSNDEEEKEEGEEGDTSVSLLSAVTDERFAQQARGGVARHRQVITRLERIGFDQRDPFPEYAFGNEDDSVDTVIPEYAGEPLPIRRQEPLQGRSGAEHVDAEDLGDYRSRDSDYSEPSQTDSEYNRIERMIHYRPGDSDDSVEDPLEPYINYDDGWR